MQRRTCSAMQNDQRDGAVTMREVARQSRVTAAAMVQSTERMRKSAIEALRDARRHLADTQGRPDERTEAHRAWEGHGRVPIE